MHWSVELPKRFVRFYPNKLLKLAHSFAFSSQKGNRKKIWKKHTEEKEKEERKVKKMSKADTVILALKKQDFFCPRERKINLSV